jgi:1,2-dihydroxy-3-keto-5-methylthiopentene dioxygenase
MSQLTVYAEADGDNPILATEDIDVIKSELGAAGIHIERWQADRELANDADNDTIIAVYQAEIDRLVAERGYQTYDVVSMNPDHPEKDDFRQKFLEEHTHSDDEVRFFVRGHGLFIIHANGRVYSILCEKDDLISVPADTKHWFDMGPNPTFTGSQTSPAMKSPAASRCWKTDPTTPHRAMPGRYRDAEYLLLNVCS